MRYFFIIFLFLSFHKLIAQPQPCDPDNPQMTSFCEDACVICDIDGFTGVNDLTAQGQPLDGFCTTQYNNMQYIAFVAGSVDLTIRVDVSNCVGGVGSLELGFFESSDCQNFEAITACDTDIQSGENQTFTNLVPLTIGQYYYMVIDGSAGSNCNWTFTVTNGTTELAPLTGTSPIEGIDVTCPDVLHTFFTAPETGATIFDWTIDGVQVGDNASNELDWTFTEDGVYTLCVQASNVCNQAPPTCKVIFVESIPQTVIVDQFCNGDCYELGDTTVCEGNPFTTTGNYEETLLTDLNCDSIVTLDLFMIVCLIQSDFIMTPVICNGTASGIIDFNVVNGTPPFTYQWQHLQTQDTGSGSISSLTDQIQLTNLFAGTYLINIEDQFGNQDVIIAEVTEPSVLENELMASDYNGFEISCFEGTNGTLSAFPSGGVPPYNYNWSNGDDVEIINELSAGNYEVMITDDVGCELIQNFELTSPSELILNPNFQNPNCDGLETGIISLISASGGVGPYEYAFEDGNYGEQTTFENLGPATYTYHLIDNNGCETSVQGTLMAPDIPDIELGENINITLGDSTMLNVSINETVLQTIEWLGTDLSCNDCLEPIIRPFDETNYTLTVTSQDGCVDTDSITVFVDKFRQLYIPNAFSPNFDGVNDYFNIYGGPEVESYDLTVFDRWGNMLYTQNNLPRESINEGWDGSFRGKRVDPGVYVWMANVHFIDGVDILYSGDITLLR